MKHEIIVPIKLGLILHTIFRYRDIQISAKGRLEPWNSNVGFEIKWDVNRNPNQKIVVSFITKSIASAVLNQYEGITSLEYPGHVTAASFVIQRRGSYAHDARKNNF